MAVEIVLMGVGVFIGSLMTWLVFDLRENDVQNEDRVRAEGQKLREEVNQHFVTTAALVNELTDVYKELFDHLSDGAGRLVEPDAIDRMPRVRDREVTIKRIGMAHGSAEEEKPEETAEEQPAPERSDQAQSAETEAAVPEADPKAEDPDQAGGTKKETAGATPG